MILIFIILTAIFSSYSYTQEKVFEYFANYDLDKDGLLQRDQYERKLIEQDKLRMIEEDQQYYSELTSLLFQKYDTDQDNALNNQEWIYFSQDIYDYTQDQGYEVDEL